MTGPVATTKRFPKTYPMAGRAVGNLAGPLERNTERLVW